MLFTFELFTFFLHAFHAWRMQHAFFFCIPTICIFMHACIQEIEKPIMHACMKFEMQEKCLTMRGDAWTCVTMRENAWKCMTMRGNVWKCMTMRDNVWKCVKNAWRLWMKIHGDTWQGAPSTCLALLEAVANNLEASCTANLRPAGPEHSNRNEFETCFT